MKGPESQWIECQNVGLRAEEDIDYVTAPPSSLAEASMFIMLNRLHIVSFA